jgi:adenosylmethionine-8-amino-7-oxononanoate aminotransferase
MASDKTKQLVGWDRENVVQPMAMVGAEPTTVYCRGRGINIEDSDGNVYMDCQAQLTCVNLGYGQREIAEAVFEQMGKLEYSTTFGNLCNESNIECSRRLAQLTQPGLKHFMYTCGGSETIDTALRVARAYWHKKGNGDKHKIISLYHSYHGVNFGASSATALGRGFFTMGTLPLVPGFLHIPNYFCYRCPLSLSYPQCGIRCARMLAYAIENEGRDSVAAFIAEPVQGTGGTLIPPPEYWPMVREICDQYDVLLIADEVMTGFGRTGKMFATENWNVVPDLMCLAKGLTSAYLPFGAVAISDKVFEGLKGALVFGFTYSGHPVCSAAASKAMEIYVRDRVVENAAEVGKYTLERLNREFAVLPCVDNVSGLGLMIGMDIVADKASRRTFPLEKDVPTQIGARAREKGLLIRAGSTRLGCTDRVSFTPPLIITRQEVDKALDILLPILADLKPE